MIKIIEPKKERFRTIPSQVFDSPFEIDMDKYEIYGYLCGQRVDKSEGLSINHFDSIQVIKESKNRLNKAKFIHAIAHRIVDKEFTIIILKEKYD